MVLKECIYCNRSTTIFMKLYENNEYCDFTNRQYSSLAVSHRDRNDQEKRSTRITRSLEPKAQDIALLKRFFF